MAVQIFSHAPEISFHFQSQPEIQQGFDDLYGEITKDSGRYL